MCLLDGLDGTHVQSTSSENAMAVEPLLEHIEGDTYYGIRQGESGDK